LIESSKAANDRITLSERTKHGALKEAAYLKAKLTAISAGSARELAKIGEARVQELENKLSMALSDNQKLQDELHQRDQEVVRINETKKRFEQMLEESEQRVAEFEQLHSTSQEQISALHERLADAENKALDAVSRSANVDHSRSFKREDMEQQQQQFRKQLEQHKRAVEQASAAVKKANDRASQAERLWHEAQERLSTLEHATSDLQSKVQSKQAELERANQRISDVERLWRAARDEASQLEAVNSVMEGVRTNDTEGEYEARLMEAQHELQQLEEEVSLQKDARERAEAMARQAEVGRRETLRRALDAERMWAGAQKELTALKRRSMAKHDQTAYLRQQMQRQEDQLRRKERECDECQVRVTTLLALLGDSDSTQAAGRMSADLSTLLDRVNFLERDREEMERTIGVLRQELGRYQGRY
jgi:chromosome segregation ATPase